MEAIPFSRYNKDVSQSMPDHHIGRRRDCGDNTFHLGGAAVFSWEPGEEDDEGNPASIVEVVEED